MSRTASGNRLFNAGKAAREYVQSLIRVQAAQKQDDSLPFQSRESVQELRRVW